MHRNNEKCCDSTAHLNPLEGLRVCDRGRIWLAVLHVPQNTAGYKPDPLP